MTNEYFDADALLAEYGDESLIAELAQLLLDNAGTQMTSVQTAVTNSDAAGLRAAAHKLRGALATFGAKTATDLAYTLEAMGKDGNTDGAAPLVMRLSAEVAALCEGARSWLSQRAA